MIPVRSVSELAPRQSKPRYASSAKQSRDVKMFTKQDHASEFLNGWDGDLKSYESLIQAECNLFADVLLGRNTPDWSSIRSASAVPTSVLEAGIGNSVIESNQKYVYLLLIHPNTSPETLDFLAERITYWAALWGGPGGPIVPLTLRELRLTPSIPDSHGSRQTLLYLVVNPNVALHRHTALVNIPGLSQEIIINLGPSIPLAFIDPVLQGLERDFSTATANNMWGGLYRALYHLGRSELSNSQIQRVAHLAVETLRNPQYISLSSDTLDTFHKPMVSQLLLEGGKKYREQLTDEDLSFLLVYAASPY